MFYTKYPPVITKGVNKVEDEEVFDLE